MENPVHPGRIIYRAYCKDLSLSTSAFAKGLKISRKQLSSLVNGRTSISPEMAIRLEKVIGSTAEAWLQMQLNFDLAQARRKMEQE